MRKVHKRQRGENDIGREEVVSKLPQKNVRKIGGASWVRDERV